MHPPKAVHHPFGINRPYEPRFQPHRRTAGPWDLKTRPQRSMSIPSLPCLTNFAAELIPSVVVDGQLGATTSFRFCESLQIQGTMLWAKGNFSSRPGR